MLKFTWIDEEFDRLTGKDAEEWYKKIKKDKRFKEIKKHDCFVYKEENEEQIKNDYAEILKGFLHVILDIEGFVDTFIRDCSYDYGYIHVNGDNVAGQMIDYITEYEDELFKERSIDKELKEIENHIIGVCITQYIQNTIESIKKIKNKNINVDWLLIDNTIRMVKQQLIKV